MSLSSESSFFLPLLSEKKTLKEFSEVLRRSFFFSVRTASSYACLLCLIKEKDIPLIFLVASALYDRYLSKELDTSSSSKLKIIKSAVSPAKLIALNRLVGDQIFCASLC
jgi:hypothetical protein